MKDPENNDIVRTTLGNKLRKAREELGLTQAEVAKRAKIGANFYATVERGEVNISFDRLNRVLKVLKIESLETI